MGVDTFSETFPAFEYVSFTDSDGTGEKYIPNTGYPVPARWDTILATSTDTVDKLLVCSTAGGLPNALGSVTIPAGAGNGTVPSVDVLAALLPAGVSGIALPDYAQLVFNLAAAASSGKFVRVIALGGML